jgi:ATP-binding cassette subfamily B protein
MADPAAFQTGDDDAVGRAFDPRLARRLLAYARPYGGLVAAAVACLLVDGVLQLAGPLLTRHVIDVAIPAGDGGGVARAAGWFVAALAGQVACGYGETMLTALLGQRVMRDLRRDVFAHLQRLPVAWFDRTPVGRVVTRATSDIESLNELFTAGVVAGLGDLVALVAISALMLAIDWRLALAAFAVVPGILLVSQVFRVKVRESYRAIRGRVARINAFLQERLGGMRVVQLFGREGAEAARFRALNDEHLRAQLRAITVYALYFPAIEILTTVALASLLVAAAGRVGAGTLTVGTVAAFLQLARRFFQPLQDLSDKYNILQQSMASSERVFALLDTPAGPPVREGTLPGDPRAVTVAFEGVWFSYALAYGGTEGADTRWALADVSFTVGPGESLALVGHTGAGKSTVLNLLLGFYEPQRGRILVNGADLRTLPVGAVRRAFGYVQQDIFLFAGDIAANVRLGAPHDAAALAAAAARVGADAVIARLPGGWAHVLGERGATVSVGERQLLAFARAVAADPAVLVLDEATSAVDSALEARIQAGIAALMQGRTTIAVAHRLSTILAATEIVVLHHGRVVERGTHAALRRRGGRYERLYRLQGGEVTPSGEPPRVGLLAP